MSLDSFKCKSTFLSAGKEYTFFDLNRLPKEANVGRLPYSLKILLENLLRTEDGGAVTKRDIQALLDWSPKTPSQTEIAFTPARVVLQDFTGVPAIVDLAAMRAAMPKIKGKPAQINPLSPVELVIDHSVMVDYYNTPSAFEKNVEMEFGRNEERYAFLRWGQMAFKNFRVVPPGTGIVHQVNLEYLARSVFTQENNGSTYAYPDTLVGTDSHTTMINGLGILGWGVGGIEAEAAMLGQPVTMLIPEVIGFKLIGHLPEGATATDLVLTVTEMLRKKNVVGKFVEFYGEGLEGLPVADRATIGNMSPEYGATVGIFPVDTETLNYLRLCGRDTQFVALVEDYYKAQGLFRSKEQREPEYSDSLTLDLKTIVPCIAGPKRPQDRIPLLEVKNRFQSLVKTQTLAPRIEKFEFQGKPCEITHGTVVIAAITSCTNTSNPDVMIGAGLLAKKALEFGLETKPWVKTSLAPGSQVVTDYLNKAGLSKPLESLGFELVGYGCTTCIGNSGPLDKVVHDAIKKGDLSVAAVLSGNRNFEGRIHPDVRLAYLASPPLVVAYALAGTMEINFMDEPIGFSKDKRPVFLRDIWPTREEIQAVVKASVEGAMFTKRYSAVFNGNKRWQELKIPTGELFQWDDNSTYVKNPPFFDDLTVAVPPIANIEKARLLALLGDSVTTDHISPAGDIAENSPAGEYLKSLGVLPKDFNSYGSRRGNHEVMMRGTFANIRLKNHIVPETEGDWTLHFPSEEKISIYDAAIRYKTENCPLIIIAGREYGTGSSRDWAAKGTRLLGVRAVIAESIERIHRSNLIGMGVLPLQFNPDENAESLQLTGREIFTISLENLKPHSPITVHYSDAAGEAKQFEVLVRIDTPKEMEYYRQGGILQYVLRQLAKKVA